MNRLNLIRIVILFSLHGLGCSLSPVVAHVEPIDKMGAIEIQESQDPQILTTSTDESQSHSTPSDLETSPQSTISNQEEKEQLDFEIESLEAQILHYQLLDETLWANHTQTLKDYVLSLKKRRTQLDRISSSD